MIKIELNRLVGGEFVEVKLIDGEKTIDLGSLDSDECDELAETLIDAVCELGPPPGEGLEEWLGERLHTCGLPRLGTYESTRDVEPSNSRGEQEGAEA